MRRAVIAASSLYTPSEVIPNQYFNDLLKEDVGTWLESNLTIRERRWAGVNESTADLVEAASSAVLQHAGVSAEAIDLIIVATDTPEYISPSTASVVQYRLGASHAGTFDLNSACAGFVTALDVAAKYIAADSAYKTILVVGAYAMSKYLDKSDKKTVTLFADGAGAFLLKASENGEDGFLGSRLRTEGQYHDWMGIYGGGTYHPLTHERLEQKEHLLRFVKKFPKELNPDIWSRMIQDLCEHLSLEPSDFSQFFFTQININSIWETLSRLDIPKDRAHTIMDRYAYTGSACIPMAFHDALEKGKVKKGDRVMFVGSGGGLSFACAAFRV